MLEALVVVPAALWLLGMATAHTLGGFIHVLLILAFLALMLLIERAPRH
ncbi:lmo0937 family membrane protein [Pseudomonas knackmussii]